MLVITDTVAGDTVKFYCAQTAHDAERIYQRFLRSRVWAMDTESTGLDCYTKGWKLRTFQFGNATEAYVLPARFRKTIDRIFTHPGVRWIGHNGPHDVRCLDAFLGYETGVVCAGETYIPAHHMDARNQEEGGTGHALKELAIAWVCRTAGKWESALKAEFKKITIPIPGEFYKSGPRKGLPKVRKARLDEGWKLIPVTNRVYLAYAASDPVLTFRLWQFLRARVRSNRDLYDFDWRVAQACDKLQRRGIRLDVPYTERLSEAYLRMASRKIGTAQRFGCANINSGKQLADVLTDLGARLTARTKKGAIKTDSKVLRGMLTTGNQDVVRFVRSVLVARQCDKRRTSYTDAMLASRDGDDRVHASINSLAARTCRMSVSRPPFQQLPTKDTESEVD